MILSLFNPILGRTLFFSRAVAFPGAATPALFKRTFLTTPLAQEEAAKPKATKQPAEKTPKVRAEKYTKAELDELKKHLKSPVKRLNSSWMAFYLKYVSENRQPAENLDTMRDHMRAASEVWRTMTAEEKETYRTSAEERAVVQAARDKWRSSPEYQSAVTAFKNTKKTEKATRRITAYAAFVAAKYDRSSPLAMAEQSKVISKQWRGLTDDQKDDWKKVALDESEKKLKKDVTVA